MEPRRGIKRSPEYGSSQCRGIFIQERFKNAVDQVKETEADVEHKQYLLATGQLDDAHTLPIAEAKASLSLDVLLTLRNKTLSAYEELIKLNV